MQKTSNFYKSILIFPVYKRAAKLKITQKHEDKNSKSRHFLGSLGGRKKNLQEASSRDLLMEIASTIMINLNQPL